MDVNKAYNYQKKIGSILVFFCVLSFFSCTKPAVIVDYTIEYKDGKAIQISFKSDKDFEDYAIFIKGNSTTPVLGSFALDAGKVIFSPIIPFSYGMTYELKQNDQSIFEFTVKETDEHTEKPKLLAIYPSKDTVPENLLKFYLVFSKPMQEVHSALDYIKVHNISKDEPIDIFLPLQNELWNQEHTELTLWLDPGRIKRDLIPNREKGQPLVEGNNYRISIDPIWQDAQGNNLDKAVVKELIVKERDSIKPNVHNWNLFIPKKGTNDVLNIKLAEAMDAMLLLESLIIRSIDQNQVSGSFVLAEQERELIFTPDLEWKAGNYELLIDSKLEDLAGNNLNHLFDKDLLASDNSLYTKFKSIFFTIK